MFMLKKILLFKIAVLYVFVSLTVHVVYAAEPLMSGIDIIELEIKDNPKNLLSIPWIDIRDNLLNETEPLLELKNDLYVYMQDILNEPFTYAVMFYLGIGLGDKIKLRKESR